MAVVISCINLKGGVGKTALAVNLSAYAGQQGKKVLLVDLDPQTNATFSTIGIEAWDEHKKNGTVADLLGARNHVSAEGEQKKAEDIIIEEVFDNVSLIPSHIDLFTVDLDLASTTARERKLKRALKDVMDDYDLIICDCPPNLTIPTQNALAMSTHFVVPISRDFLSGIGIGLLLNRIEQLSGDLEVELENAGIVISRVGRPAQHREETEKSIRDRFGDKVLGSVIKERSSVSKAAEDHISIFETTDQKAQDEFEAVSNDILIRAGILL